MILREKTLEEFGYDTNNLKQYSRKIVWVECPLCHEYWKKEFRYFNYCKNWKCLDCHNRNNKWGQKYTVNDVFFENPNIFNSYYAGLLAADGNIVKNNNIVRIGLKQENSEIDLLEKFKNDCEYTGKFYYNNNNIQLLVTSKQWQIDLWDNFNIGPAKSLTICPPNLMDNNAIAFIIGYLDGDGSIYFKKRNRSEINIQFNINFEGTLKMLEWIQTIIKNKFNINPVTIRRIANIYSMDWTGSEAIKLYLKLKQFIEINNLPFLERKWTKDLSKLHYSPKYAKILNVPLMIRK
jgi:hypothetical protein